MSTIIVRVTSEEKEFLDRIAKFENKSLSELMKTHTLESLEDIYDANVGDLAYEEYLENSISRPLSELLDEYNI